MILNTNYDFKKLHLIFQIAHFKFTISNGLLVFNVQKSMINNPPNPIYPMLTKKEIYLFGRTEIKSRVTRDLFQAKLLKMPSRLN